MKIVFATSNPHKLQEINEISRGCGIEFVLPKGEFSPVENGLTFEENSLIKAKEAWTSSKMITLADDSGLCVDFLNGEPGIYSARYEDTQIKKISKILNKLSGINKRTAYFACAMTLLDSNGELLFSTVGKCLGKIANEPRGKNGFGYDPIFIVDGYDLTMAELSDIEKNKISHRANALNCVLNFLKEFNIT